MGSRRESHLVLRRQAIEEMGRHIAQSIDAIAVGIVVGFGLVVVCFQASLSSGLFHSFRGNGLARVLEMALICHLAFLAMIARPFAIALAVVLANGLS